jgi:hypothetical protein
MAEDRGAIARYILEESEALAKVARDNEMPTLAYILAMAREQALQERGLIITKRSTKAKCSC